MQTDPVGYQAGINLYTYCNNNPVNLTDSTGQWFGLDDLIASVGGAIVGVVSQAISDVISGELSGWEDYTGALVGGAVAGEATLYVGPVVGFAAGGAVTNATTQGLRIVTGKQEDFDATSFLVETGVGAITGAIPVPKISGLNAGRGSFKAIEEQMLTKISKNPATKITLKTAGKMAAYETYSNAKDMLIPGAVEGIMRSAEKNVK